jgi:hypothetical protein
MTVFREWNGPSATKSTKISQNFNQIFQIKITLIRKWTYTFSTGAMSWAKFKVADMSLPVTQDDTAVIVPFPSERSKTALFIAPFQTNVCIL